MVVCGELVDFVLHSSSDRNFGAIAPAERRWRIFVPVVARGRGSGAELVRRHGSRLAGAKGDAVRLGGISYQLRLKASGIERVGGHQ
jgi:hypothetical protein